MPPLRTDRSLFLVLALLGACGGDADDAGEPVTPMAARVPTPTGLAPAAPSEPEPEPEPVAPTPAVARVHGAVETRLGSPVPERQVWFLRPGEKHPETNAAGSALASTRTDLSGRFAAELDPGPYRLSVGPPGTAELTMTDAAALTPRSEHEVTVVHPVGTRLDVSLDVMPQDRGRITLHAFRREPLDEQASQNEWILEGGETVTPEGTARFEHLPPGEYRLRLTVGRTRYDSELRFVLDVEHVIRVAVEVPAPDAPIPPGRQAPALPILVEQGPLPEGTPYPGFAWK